jgi:hypothetical protein
LVPGIVEHAIGRPCRDARRDEYGLERAVEIGVVQIAETGCVRAGGLRGLRQDVGNARPARA